ncbi:MAG: DUF4214 domain-containing protein [Telluria sp.]
MPKLSDIETTFTSGLNHIDALLDSGPDWNFLTPLGNTITYTFSIASGNEVRGGVPVTGQQAFSISQQNAARSAFEYISRLTGIVFAETGSGDGAQVHLANIDIASSDTVGLCSWNVSYRSNASTNELISYDADAYVYLDNREFAGVNANLTAGGQGYETLLHELGHMLGLKHPHEDDIVLSPFQDNTANTLMSYNDIGGPYREFNDIDVAALNWIYGGDGLRGALGINSLTGAQYLTGSNFADNLVGTAGNDKLQGGGGNDLINGGEGIDTAVFNGIRAAYAFNEVAGGALQSTGAEGTDIHTSIEQFQFFDGTFQRSQLADSTPPPVPTPNVAKNAAGYVVGNKPTVFGIAEANSTVRVFSSGTEVATGKADANGFFNIITSSLTSGNYTLGVTATDAAGNVSGSASVAFKVDAIPPAVPTGAFQLSGANANQPVFNGTGEVGTTISLVLSSNEVIGRTVVDGAGKWTIAPGPLGNGNYSVSVQSSDIADNVTPASAPLAFNINSTLNLSGGAGNDVLRGTAGNNALDGVSGFDTAAYGGARAAYTVEKSTNGFTIRSAADGFDSLLNVDRIQFGDTSMAVALDLAGNGGQAYRLYSAVLGRAPDKGGLGFWIDKLDDGITMQDVSNAFLGSQEFITTYGANLTNTEFVDELYQNVLHRSLDQAGFDFWVAAIEQHGVARADILISFSESNENQAQVIGQIQNGIDYVPWTA